MAASATVDVFSKIPERGRLACRSKRLAFVGAPASPLPKRFQTDAVADLM